MVIKFIDSNQIIHWQVFYCFCVMYRLNSLSYLWRKLYFKSLSDDCVSTRLIMSSLNLFLKIETFRDCSNRQPWSAGQRQHFVLTPCTGLMASPWRWTITISTLHYCDTYIHIFQLHRINIYLMHITINTWYFAFLSFTNGPSITWLTTMHNVHDFHYIFMPTPKVNWHIVSLSYMTCICLAVKVFHWMYNPWIYIHIYSLVLVIWII